MAKAKPERVKSEEERTQEREFYRRRSLAGTEVRYMHTERTSDVVLMNRGREIGSRTEFRKRGTVTSVLYVLPHL